MRHAFAAAGSALLLSALAAAPGRDAAAQGTAGPGMDRLEPGQMTADQIAIVLKARGYSDLAPMGRDGDTVAVASGKRYGEDTGPLRLDAKTGQVRDEAPMTTAQVQALLRDRGFTEVRETGREGDAVLASGERAGSRIDLRVDARSGAVAQR